MTGVAVTSPKDILSPKEIQELTHKGAEAAKGHEIEIPPQPKETLQKFVLGYVAGQVYIDRDVPPDLMGMVFMPLLFGALQPEGEADEALKAVLLDVGEEPVAVEHPGPLELPPEPERPSAPKLLVPDPEKVKKIQSEIEWQDMRQEDLDAYLAQIKRLNEARQAKYQIRVQKWEEALYEWKRACQSLEGDYLRQSAEHEASEAQFEQNFEAWERKSAQNDAIRRGFMEQFASTLGCVWEDVSKAGPRAINGYPAFMSCRLMNKDDFARAATAINRELERVQDLEI
jgi:hypothetical protein